MGKYTFQTITMSDIRYGDEINLSLGVTNLERAVSFFNDRLGFKTVFVDEKHRWATIATSLAGVTLGLAERESTSEGGGAIPTFGVEDIEAARKELEAADVRFDGPTVEIPGVTKFATFYDPDNNAFMLAQKLR